MERESFLRAGSSLSSKVLLLEMVEISQVGDARRQAQNLARSVGLSDVKTSNYSIIVSELATNLVKHAKAGKIILQIVRFGSEFVVEVISFDSGPGMNDISRCLRDGYSTGGTSGNGLGAISRLADEFDIYSEVDKGTIVLGRIKSDSWNSSLIAELGVISCPIAGESICGDAWSFAASLDQLSFTVIDGLGHGPYAAESAMAATMIFNSNPFLNPVELVSQAHLKLNGMRGAAIGVGCVDARSSLSYVGVGNINAAYVTDQLPKKSLMTNNGTVGLLKPRISDTKYSLNDPGIIILHSDGLSTRWSIDAYPGLTRRDPALIAAALFRDYSRSRDDATVMVIKYKGI